MNFTAYGSRLWNNSKIKKIWFDIKTACKKDYLKTLLVFSFLFLSFGLMYFSINRLISLDDHLFYMRFAEIIKEKGFGVTSDFHWIYFSKNSQESFPVYYAFLYYLVLIPFTFIKPLVLAIKLYGVVFFALSFTSLYYFLLKIGTKKSFLWTLIPLAILNNGELGRFLLARPYTFAPALLLLELYFLYKKKYWGVFLISLFYFYWQNATFIFTLIIPILFVLFENFYGKKIDFKLISASAAAIIIDLLIAVFYAPGLLYTFSMLFNIYNDTILGKVININEGMENYPIQFFDYLKLNIPLIALFTVAVIFEIYQYIQSKRNQGQDGHVPLPNEKQPLKSTLFFMSLLLFLGNFFSARNNDFFVFFSGAYIAMSFDEIIGYIDIKKELIKKTLAISVYVIVAYLFVANLLFLQDQIARVKPYDTIQGAAEWLKKNTNEKEIIFYPTWDWFTQLFHYDSQNYYIIGLVPRFLYDYNPELYWAWRNISAQGFLCLEDNCDAIIKKQQYYLRDEDRKKEWYKEEGNLIADYIKNNFRSRFVLTSRDFPSLNEVMNNSNRFEKVFTDNVYQEFSIYKIN